MRGPEHIATAIRRLDKSIEVCKEPFISITKKNKFYGYPIIRGFVSLIEMMIIGFKSLDFSAKAYEKDYAEETVAEKSGTRKKLEDFLAISISVVLAFALFGYLPYQLASWIQLSKQNVFFNLFAGLIRIVFFVVYVWLISRIKDIHRVFEYHGAEHKTIHAYEKENSTDIKVITGYTTLHPRCGTSFIFLVLLISILVFSIVDTIVTISIGYPIIIVRLAYHLFLLPLVSGISYEVLKLSEKKINHPLVKLFTVPGMSLQYITTQQPNEEQIEVAVIAMKAALDMDLSEHDNVSIITT